jgi:hypothetical protein
MLGVIGFSQAFWMLVVFAPMHRRFGTIGLMRICAIGWPVGFTIMPIALVLVRRRGDEASFWTLGILAQMFSSGVSMAFSTSFLLFSFFYLETNDFQKLALNSF